MIGTEYVNDFALAQYLGISRNTVHSFAKRGILPQGIRLGHSRRWSISEVKQWLNQSSDKKEN